MPRSDPPTTGTEAAVVTGFLDFLRETIALKTEGLDAAGFRFTHPPSTMTLGGMLKHLAYVKNHWGGEVLLGREPSPPWDTAPWDDDVDWDWHSAADDDPEHLRSLWRDAVERSRADVPLDDLGRLSAVEKRGERFSARWCWCTSSRSTAGTPGTDLLREAIDGTTGE